MDRLLVAIVLLDFILFSVLRVTFHVLSVLLFFAVDLLVVLLLVLSALLHSFVLIHELVLLNHALEVLKNHLTRQKASNQSLDLYDGYESTLVYLYAILIVIVFIFNNIFARFDFYIILFSILKCIFVLLFIWPNHHVSAIFIFFASGAEATTLPVVMLLWVKVIVRLLFVHHVTLYML